MGQLIHIEGTIENLSELSLDDLMNEFIDFIESKHCEFSGGWYPVDDNGERLKSK